MKTVVSYQSSVISPQLSAFRYKYFSFILLFSFFFSFAANGQTTDEVLTDPLQADMRVVASQLHNGENTKLIIQMTLPKGYHAYADKFSLRIDQPEGIPFSKPIIAPLVEFLDKVSNRKKMGVVDVSTFETIIEIPPHLKSGTYEIQARLTYQACTEKYCLFPKEKKLAAALEIVPTAGSEPVNENFFSQSLFSSDLNVLFSRGLIWTFLAVFFLGILTSFTPCILPMIPITMSILSRGSAERTRGRNIALGLCYIGGIALTYSLLGLFAAQTGALFGSWLGQPWVVFTIGVVFLALSLSMYGLYELQIPAPWRNRLGSTPQKQGLTGAFLTGLVSAIVASPCVGPVLVGILTWVAQTKNLALGFSLLFVYSLGLGTLQLLFAFSKEISRFLPKSQSAMKWTKIFFGSLMLAVSLYYFEMSIPELIGGSTSQLPPEQRMNWIPYSKERFKSATLNKKPVILDFTAEWCAACQELEEFTYSKEDVVAEGRKFELLKVDATKISPEIERIHKEFNVVGLPTILFFDPSGVLTDRLIGFENSKSFLQRMKKTSGQ